MWHCDSAPAGRCWRRCWFCDAVCHSGTRWAASWARWNGSHWTSAASMTPVPPVLSPAASSFSGTAWTATVRLCCCSAQTLAPHPASTAVCIDTGILGKDIHCSVHIHQSETNQVRITGDKRKVGFVSTCETVTDADLCPDPQGCDIFRGGPAWGPWQPPESVQNKEKIIII